MLKHWSLINIRNFTFQVLQPVTSKLLHAISLAVGIALLCNLKSEMSLASLCTSHLRFQALNFMRKLDLIWRRYIILLYCVETLI